MMTKYTQSPKILVWRNIFYTTRNFRVLKHIESCEIFQLGKLFRIVVHIQFITLYIKLGNQ